MNVPVVSLLIALQVPDTTTALYHELFMCQPLTVGWELSLRGTLVTHLYTLRAQHSRWDLLRIGDSGQSRKQEIFSTALPCGGGTHSQVSVLTRGNL